MHLVGFTVEIRVLFIMRVSIICIPSSGIYADLYV